MKKDKEYLKAIVRRCIKKDSEAWDELIKLISPLITYIIKDKLDRLGLNYLKKDVNGLKQDILLSLWEKNKLKTIKDEEKIIPWICAITANATSSYIRNLKPIDLPNLTSLDDLLKSPYPSPFEELSNKDIHDDIDRALKSLNYKENLIIKLSLLYEKKYKEISQILNIPLGTVLVNSKRAKLKLRKSLKKYKENM